MVKCDKADVMRSAVQHRQKILEGHEQQGEKVFQLCQFIQDRKNALRVAFTRLSDRNFKLCMKFSCRSILSDVHGNMHSQFKY